MTKPRSWRPFEDMLDFQQEVMDTVMDEVAQNVFGRRHGKGQQRLRVDLAENSEMYVLRAALPGLRPDDVIIDFSDNVLTISAESKPAEEQEGTRYHLRELFTGKLERSFRFPVVVNSEAIEAQFEDGILVLYVPKSQTARSRRIKVQTPGVS